ncbi:MAG: NUDIX domain-containing protein [Ignavibacteria bacterium]|nr:NUDIX domain-containing protein [Ignavibacteria bacterium]
MSYKFLCLKRNDDALIYPGIWQIITAKIEKDEKAYDTAKRELFEETGLHPKQLFIGPSINQFYSLRNDSINLIPIFIAEVDSTEVKISDEHSEFEWLSFEDTYKRVYWGNQKDRLEEIYKYLKSEELYNTLVKII